MDGLARIWSAGDGVSRTVAVLLLAMSVSAWVLILWKGWVLTRARRDLARAVPVFWSAPDVPTGRTQLAALDREQVLVPMLDALLQQAAPGTLDAGSDAESRLTRLVRAVFSMGPVFARSLPASGRGDAAHARLLP